MGGFPATPPWHSLQSLFDSRKEDSACVGCLSPILNVICSRLTSYWRSVGVEVLMHMQSCCFAYLNFFLTFPLPSPS